MCLLAFIVCMSVASPQVVIDAHGGLWFLLRRLVCSGSGLASVAFCRTGKFRTACGSL